MPTTTTNFALNKPLVNNATDQDLWGGYLNDNFDTIDTTLLLCRDWKKRVITGTDSVVAGDRHKILLCDATSAAFTETLLAAATAGDGFELTIVKTDSSANAVTVDGAGAETVAGAANFSLTGQGDAITLVCDGVSNWNFKGNKTTPSAVPSATTTSQGIIEIATDAEVLAGVDTSRAVVPASIAALATNTATGKLTIGPLTFQWGVGTSSAAGILTNFGVPFSNNAHVVIVCPTSSSSTNVISTALTQTGFTASGPGSGTTIAWFAIGPT